MSEEEALKPLVQWGSDEMPDMVLWRAEFPGRGCAAEVQKTAMGIGVLVLFDHEKRNRVMTSWPVPLPSEGDAEAYDECEVGWNATVRAFLYPPPQPIVQNTYRRGGRRK